VLPRSHVLHGNTHFRSSASCRNPIARRIAKRSFEALRSHAEHGYEKGSAILYLRSRSAFLNRFSRWNFCVSRAHSIGSCEISGFYAEMLEKHPSQLVLTQFD
jgi:hypothetical protein